MYDSCKPVRRIIFHQILLITYIYSTCYEIVKYTDSNYTNMTAMTCHWCHACVLSGNILTEKSASFTVNMIYIHKYTISIFLYCFIKITILKTHDHVIN